MGGLRNSSKVLHNLGNLCIITGTITVNSNTWTLSANDDDVSLTDLGAGNVRLDFDAFLAAPSPQATILKATHEAGVVKNVLVEAVTTTTCEFVHHSIDDTGAGATDVTTVDPDDDDGWTFCLIGVRNK